MDTMALLHTVTLCLLLLSDLRSEEGGDNMIIFHPERSFNTFVVIQALAASCDQLYSIWKDTLMVLTHCYLVGGANEPVNYFLSKFTEE